jgi:hypothetical protein
VPRCEVCREELPELRVGNSPNAGTCYWNASAQLRRLRPTAGGVLYVEGWAVRRYPDGRLEPFEHGWVELDGTIADDTPHHHVASTGAYFGALRLDDPFAEGATLGVDIPLYRHVTCPSEADGRPNPRYDPKLARVYAQARLDAEAYCRGNG